MTHEDAKMHKLKHSGRVVIHGLINRRRVESCTFGANSPALITSQEFHEGTGRLQLYTVPTASPQNVEQRAHIQTSTFSKEGNNFLDGKAKKYDIPDPIEYYGGETAEGETWIVSQNAETGRLVCFDRGITPAITQCKVKDAFKFSYGRGAILVMDKISLIDPPGVLRSLLEHLSMCGMIVGNYRAAPRGGAKWLGGQMTDDLHNIDWIVLKGRDSEY
ncbi:hypothetical protein B0H14DRAFT_3630548 [Mycena olivaceomarginata]|nr:hypothetical protein B0H14DRAFT_3630548 [Mycena olivaceomarginata]